MLKVLGINNFVVLEVHRKNPFSDAVEMCRRISLLPEQITQVESRQIGDQWYVVVAWKEPNAEVLEDRVSSQDEAIKTQDEILQMIHNITFRERYG